MWLELTTQYGDKTAINFDKVEQVVQISESNKDSSIKTCIYFTSFDMQGGPNFMNVREPYEIVVGLLQNNSTVKTLYGKSND